MKTLPLLLALPLLCGVAARGLRAEPLTLEGRVLAPGGVPLAGAEVEMRQLLSNFDRGVRAIAELPGVVSLQAVADSRGDFALPVPRGEAVEVRVSAPGFVPMRFLTVPLSEDRVLPSVSLVPDSGVRIRVLGPRGKGVHGARVVAQPLEDSGSGFPWWGPQEAWEATPRTGATGDDGGLRLPARRGERLRLFAQGAGFPIQGAVDVRAPAEAEIRLVPGVRHELRFRGGSEDLLRVALVRDLQTGWPLGVTKNRTLPFVGPARGTAWLAVETEDGGSWPFAVPAGSREVRVEVPAPRTLTVRVSDAADGKPLAGAWVWDPRDPGRGVRADATGTARYTATEPSVRQRLRAVAPGYLQGQRHWGKWVPEGDLALALSPAPLYLGKVVDPAGRAAEGAEVQIAGGVGRVTAGGTVRLVSRWEEDYPGLVANGPGFRDRRASLDWQPARESRFTLTLLRGVEVTGRVVDGSGAGVAEAEVRLDVLAERGTLGPLPGPSTASDASGRFRLDGIVPGTYELRVQAPGRALFRKGGLEVRAATSGGSAARGPLDLGVFALDEGVPLTGRVAGPEGRPLAGVEVWLRTLEGLPGTDLWPAAVSGADGRFALAGLGAGTPLRLTLCREDRFPLELKLSRPPAEPLALVLPQAGVLVGRELDEDGLPSVRSLMEARLGYQNDDELYAERHCPGPARRGVTDGSGWFRIGPLAPRLYDLDGQAVPLAAGEVREVESRLPSPSSREGSLSGRVLDAEGMPLAGVELRLDLVEPADDRNVTYSMSSTSDALGRYWFEGLLPERWGLGLRETLDLEEVRIVAGPNRRDLVLPGKGPRRVADPAPKDLGELGPSPYEETPRGAARISGRLLGLAPGELAGARVGLSFGAGPLSIDWLGTVAPDGAYEIAGLPPDEEVSIVAQAGDRRVWEEQRIVAGVDQVTRDLVFPPVVPLDGKVLDPDGNGLAGAQVTLWSPGRTPEISWQQVAAVASDAEGGFALRLPAGKYRVEAERPGYLPLRWPAERSLVASDPPSHRSEDRLRLVAAAELRGRLPGLAPEDIRELNIEADDSCCTEEGRHYVDDAVIGPDGLYRIGGLGPGEWDIEARLDSARLGRRSLRQRVRIPEDGEATLDLDFRVGDLAVAGEVLGQGLRPLPGSYGAIADEEDYGVAARLPDGTEVASTSARHGKFRLGFLRPGRYVLVLSRGPYPFKEVARQEVELPRREPVVWDVRGGPGAARD